MSDQSNSDETRSIVTVLKGLGLTKIPVRQFPENFAWNIIHYCSDRILGVRASMMLDQKSGALKVISYSYHEKPIHTYFQATSEHIIQLMLMYDWKIFIWTKDNTAISFSGSQVGKASDFDSDMRWFESISLIHL